MWTIDEDGPVFVNTDSPKIDFYCSRLCYPTAGKRSLISRGQSTGGSRFLADNSKFSLDMEIQIGNSFMRKYRVNVATSKYRISSNNKTRGNNILFFRSVFAVEKQSFCLLLFLSKRCANFIFFFEISRKKDSLYPDNCSANLDSIYRYIK